MFVILLILTAITLFYVYLKWTYSYWKRNNVPGPEPTNFIGNIGSALSFKENWAVVLADWYKEYVNEPYVGFYKLMTPGLIIRDADLVKDILSKDFDKFEVNDVVISKKYDPLAALGAFFAVGDEWRESRKSIVPAFSSTKLKNIFPLMNRAGEELVQFIKSYEPNTDFEARELFRRFTVQNAVRCGFSIDPMCFDKNEVSDFIKMSQNSFDTSFLVGIKFMLLLFLPPWAADYIPIPIIPERTRNFFGNVVKSNKESRTKENHSVDLMQMLIDTQDKKSIKTDELLAANAFAFFGDGTDTSSQALSFALYELAANPDIQQKLYDEIMEKFEANNGQLTTDIIQNMDYLEAVLLESMRLHPPFAILAKRTTKAYKLPKNDHQSEEMTIYPGTVINIPIIGIHMDPKYYPEPEKFNPDRFSPEEQRNRRKGTYLIFGEGPRSCPGMRFALGQMKVGLAYVIMNFCVKLSPNHKPIVIAPHPVAIMAKDGILLQFEAR